MTIIAILLTKALWIVFLFSILYMIRQVFLFGRHISKPEPGKYILDPRTIIYIGLALSIIITGLIKGVGV